MTETLDVGPEGRITLRPRMPCVVVDMTVLQSISGGEGFPGEFSVIIPDRVLWEIAGKEDQEGPRSTEELTRKLNRLILHKESRGRVLVGRNFDDVIHGESTPTSVRPGTPTAVHDEFSIHVCHQQDLGQDPLGIPTPEHTASLPDGKEAFVRQCREFVSWMKENRPASLKKIRSEKDVGLLIQGSSDVLARIAANRSPKYRGADWQREIRDHFPDRCALARLLRIEMWYSLVAVLAPDSGDKKLGNNYDDAHYVFLSLYTKHLWTEDPGMKLAARAISGGRVAVHGDCQSIPTY